MCSSLARVCEELRDLDDEMTVQLVHTLAVIASAGAAGIPVLQIGTEVDSSPSGRARAPPGSLDACSAELDPAAVVEESKAGAGPVGPVAPARRLLGQPGDRSGRRSGTRRPCPPATPGRRPGAGCRARRACARAPGGGSRDSTPRRRPGRERPRRATRDPAPRSGSGRTRAQNLGEPSEVLAEFIGRLGPRTGDSLSSA